MVIGEYEIFGKTFSFGERITLEKPNAVGRKTKSKIMEGVAYHPSASPVKKKLTGCYLCAQPTGKGPVL
jgi:hypothetical protein